MYTEMSCHDTTLEKLSNESKIFFFPEENDSLNLLCSYGGYWSWTGKRKMTEEQKKAKQKSTG